MSEVFELFRNSEFSLSNDNILRGFFLFPTIEISELTEIFESALATMADETSMPGVAGMEGVSCDDRATLKASVEFCVALNVFVHNVQAVVAVDGGGGGLFDFLGKKDDLPLLSFYPLI